MYRNIYRNILVRSEYGFLEPEMFCPNKALHSLHYLSNEAKGNHDQIEVTILMTFIYINIEMVEYK